MGRIFAVFGVLMTLAACGVGGWVAARPPMKLLLVPGARDVEVMALGWGTWQISYYAPGAPTTWYTDVAHQLEAQHWSSLDQVAYAPLTRIYSRAVSFGFCDLWEWTYLTFDPLRPHSAQIKVRRWVAFP